VIGIQALLISYGFFCLAKVVEKTENAHSWQIQRVIENRWSMVGELEEIAEIVKEARGGKNEEKI
jgi:hypothetical protein